MNLHFDEGIYILTIKFILLGWQWITICKVKQNIFTIVGYYHLHDFSP